MLTFEELKEEFGRKQDVELTREEIDRLEDLRCKERVKKIPSVAESVFSQIISKIDSEEIKIYTVTLSFQGRRIIQGSELKGFQVVTVHSEKCLIQQTIQKGGNDEEDEEGY